MLIHTHLLADMNKVASNAANEKYVYVHHEKTGLLVILTRFFLNLLLARGNAMVNLPAQTALNEALNMYP